MFNDPVFYTVVTTFVVGAAAAGAVKATLNGTVERMRAIHKELQEHIKDESRNDVKTLERIASLETKVDTIIDRLNR